MSGQPVAELRGMPLCLDPVSQVGQCLLRRLSGLLQRLQALIKQFIPMEPQAVQGQDAVWVVIPPAHFGVFASCRFPGPLQHSPLPGVGQQALKEVFSPVLGNEI